MKMYLASSFKDIAKIFEQLEQPAKGKRAVFIPTASIVEGYTAYVKSGKKALEKMGLIIDILEISTAAPEVIAEKLDNADYIYVSGGNTFFLLQELRRTGADIQVIRQVRSGTVYIGESAGAMIVSPNIEYVKAMDDCKKAEDLQNYDGLDLVGFYPVPHCTNFPFRKAADAIISKYDTTLQLYPISNAQMIFVDNQTVKVLSK